MKGSLDALQSNKLMHRNAASWLVKLLSLSASGEIGRYLPPQTTQIQ